MNINDIFIRVFSKIQEIKIAPKGEYYLCGYCRYKKTLFETETSLFVYSQKGWQYLLLSMASKILAESDIQEYADAKYKYAIGVGASEIDHFLNRTTVEIFFADEQFKIVSFRVHLENLDEVPGVKREYILEKTLEDVFTKLRKKTGKK